MAIETRPKFKLGMISRDSQPMGSKCYWFRTGESFVTIAQKLNVEPLKLIKYNFGTTDPAEVNWYLREYIGYVQQTRDGKNWMFAPDRKDVREGRRYIFVPLSYAERRAIAFHYHLLILERMGKLIHDFGDPAPQMGQPSFPLGLDSGGRQGVKENEYLNGLVGYAEVIRVLIWPDDYAATSGRDDLEPPPEFPTVYAKRPDLRKPRGKGYGKGFDAAIEFWEETIGKPREVRSVTQMKGAPVMFNGPIRIRIPDILARTDARDLFDKLKKFIEDERARFRSSKPWEKGEPEPYIWDRP